MQPLTKAAALSACIFTSSIASAAGYYSPQTGAGSYYSPQPMYQQNYVDPTQKYPYKLLAPIEPYAKRGEALGQGLMRCSAGGMAFLPAGPGGMAVGCAAGAYMR